ncbi:hypothetical protein ACIRQP_17270 [Streptomyces sp. NPDC102274]|uniref:hypothetical protein n=1 Tax=Streptomyces sp. NPDC102274 TaxID=3366151 RepID=UPI0038045B67
MGRRYVGIVIDLATREVIELVCGPPCTHSSSGAGVAAQAWRGITSQARSAVPFDKRDRDPDRDPDHAERRAIAQPHRLGQRAELTQAACPIPDHRPGPDHRQASVRRHRVARPASRHARICPEPNATFGSEA